MSPQGHKEEDLYNAALALPPAQRADFLAEACVGDAALRERVEALLKVESAADAFFATEVIDCGTKVLAGHLSPPPGIRLRYFGDYELIEEIARGGMGVVWKARQVSLNRIVALKMMLAGEFAAGSDVRRFQAEAEAAANLQHPNIVAIHEVGEHDGQHYFSMDYVEGKTLAELIKDRALTSIEAARHVMALAEAVHYAHQRGILHRDLKPSNVLVDAEGRLRITDFGLAKQMKGDSSLTQTGAVLGTPSYMAPEQARGQAAEIGPWSDVYALGAILYHLLTGKPPFTGATAIETLQKVLAEETEKPSRWNPNLPGDLETICLKCLEKRPQHRYATARLLSEELQRFLDGDPLTATPPSPARKCWNWLQRRPWLMTSVFASLLMLSVLLTYGLYQKLRHQILQTKVLRLDRELDAMKSSRESRTLHYAGVINELMEVASEFPEWEHHSSRIRRVIGAGETPRRINNNQQASPTSKTMSQDGRYLIAAFANGSLEVFQVLDGACVFSQGVLVKSNNTLACSRDGQFLAIANLNRSSGEVRIWNWSKNTEPTVFKPHLGGVSAIAFSPDGSRLATAGQAESEPGHQLEIKIWDLETLSLKHVIHCFKNASRVEPLSLRVLRGNENYVSELNFNPDGSILAASSQVGLTLVMRLADLRGIEMDADAISLGGMWQTRSVCFSPDGTELIWATNNYPAHLYATRLESLTTRILITERVVESYSESESRAPSTSFRLRISPDGRHLVQHHVAFDLRNGGREIILPEAMSACTPDGEWLSEYGFRFWRIADYQAALRTLPPIPKAGAIHVLMHPDRLITSPMLWLALGITALLHAGSLSLSRSFKSTGASLRMVIIAQGLLGAVAFYMMLWAVHLGVWFSGRMGEALLWIGCAWTLIVVVATALCEAFVRAYSGSPAELVKKDATPAFRLFLWFFGNLFYTSGIFILAGMESSLALLTGVLGGFIAAGQLKSDLRNWRGTLCMLAAVFLATTWLGVTALYSESDKIVFLTCLIWGLLFSGPMLAWSASPQFRNCGCELKGRLKLMIKRLSPIGVSDQSNSSKKIKEDIL